MVCGLLGDGFLRRQPPAGERPDNQIKQRLVVAGSRPMIASDDPAHACAVRPPSVNARGQAMADKFIEFETVSGKTTLNVRHIVQIVKSKTGNDTELILATGGTVLVKPPYEEVCDSVERRASGPRL